MPPLLLCQREERGRGAAGAGSERCPREYRAQVRGCPAAASPAVPQGGGAGKEVPSGVSGTEGMEGELVWA